MFYSDVFVYQFLVSMTAMRIKFLRRSEGGDSPREVNHFTNFAEQPLRLNSAVE